MMNYYFSKTLTGSHDETIDKVTASLKNAGFGIVSVINLHEKFKEKLGIDFKKYTILGACNPAYAYKVIQAEEKIGTMLPCNVVVIEKENGTNEVAAINPVASMMAVHNPSIEPLAEEVTETLRAVVEGL